MSLFKKVLVFLCVMIPALGEAATVWSSCQTVVAVQNQMADVNGIAVYFSPGISGCGTGSYSLSQIIVGQQGVTSSNINSILATVLAAQLSGVRVAIQYDPSTASSYGSDVAIGGNIASGIC